MSDSVRPQRWQPTRLPRPWDSPGKNTGVGCHFLLQCMKVKSESEVAQSCPTLSNPWTAAHQAPPSMGFSRQEYWSGVPSPSPIYYCIWCLIKSHCRYKWMNETGSREDNWEVFATVQMRKVWSKVIMVQVEERGQKDLGEIGFMI